VVCRHVRASGLQEWCQEPRDNIPVDKIKALIKSARSSVTAPEPTLQAGADTSNGRRPPRYGWRRDLFRVRPWRVHRPYGPPSRPVGHTSPTLGSPCPGAPGSWCSGSGGDGSRGNVKATSRSSSASVSKGWSAGTVATMLRAERGTSSWALRVKWTRQRAPSACTSTDFTTHRWSSLLTQTLEGWPLDHLPDRLQRVPQCADPEVDLQQQGVGWRQGEGIHRNVHPALLSSAQS
jgi:hypothetical protein